MNEDILLQPFTKVIHLMNSWTIPSSQSSVKFRPAVCRKLPLHSSRAAKASVVWHTGVSSMTFVDPLTCWMDSWEVMRNIKAKEPEVHTWRFVSKCLRILEDYRATYTFWYDHDWQPEFLGIWSGDTLISACWLHYSARMTRLVLLHEGHTYILLCQVVQLALH